MERRGDANFCCISNDNLNFFENEEDALEFIYERSIENAKQSDIPDVNPFSGGYIFPLDLEVTNTSCLLLSSDHVNFHHDNRPKSDLALEVFLHGSENPWTSHGSWTTLASIREMVTDHWLLHVFLTLVVLTPLGYISIQ